MGSRPLVAGLVLFAGACIGDPSGPTARLRVERLVSATDTAIVGAPGRPLVAPLHFRVVDDRGYPVPGASVAWSVSPGSGQLESPDEITRATGDFQSGWILGTNAAQIQRVGIDVRTREGSGHLDIAAEAVMAIFQSRLSNQIEGAFSEITRRVSERSQ